MFRRHRITTPLVAVLMTMNAGLAVAQEEDAAGSLDAVSENVLVHKVTDNAESCVYDTERGVILAINRAEAPREKLNDGFVSFIGHDGSVVNAHWAGDESQPPLLNQPYGSAVLNGTLYVADRNGGTSKDDPTRAVLRMIDLEDGASKGEVNVNSPGLNDITVAADGTVYATQTNVGPKKNGPDTWKVFAISPSGEVSDLIQGQPLNLPNGIEMDGDGNIVVVNLGDSGVLTFSPSGELLKTEEAAQPGSDGLVIMPDGTKYVNSLRQGGISKIAPGGGAELIATGIPGAASMCYDSGSNQLVVPTGSNDALAFVPLN